MSSLSQLVNELNETISSFKSRVDVKIEDVSKATTNIRLTTNKIYDNINKFKKDMMQNEEKQIAHENILRIDQIIKEQFSNYITIRRTVIGVVRDFDIDLVRNSTIQELSEELWITSSRYWLAYALIAITAWVNDYPDIAKNALAECGRKDKIKTTLFFCLMNLRFNRMETAKKWFFEYLRTLDPTILQQETAVLLQAFINGIFGKDKELEHEVKKLIDSWIAIINDNKEISQDIVKAYEEYIEGRNTTINFQYQAISSFCANSSQVKKAFYDVLKYDLLIEFINSLDLKERVQNEANYKTRIDEVLVNLISNFDKEELELREQQEYFKFVVKNGGMVEKAKEQYKATQELQNVNFNIGKQMVKWAIYDEDGQMDLYVRKFGLQNTKLWFKEAINNWSNRVQATFPRKYSLNIDTWQGVSNGHDQVEQNENMMKYFETHRFQMKYVNSYNIATLLAVIVSLILIFVSWYSLIIAVATVGILVYRIIEANKTFHIRVDNAVNNLNRCIYELAEFENYYEENCMKKDVLMQMIEFF